MCQISYLRTARVGETAAGPIRMTLDQDLRALATGGLAFDHARQGTLISEQGHILELKYRYAMPAVFKQLVDEFRLNPQAVSKYRLAAVVLGFAVEPELNGNHRKLPEEAIRL